MFMYPASYKWTFQEFKKRLRTHIFESCNINCIPLIHKNNTPESQCGCFDIRTENETKSGLNINW